MSPPNVILELSEFIAALAHDAWRKRLIASGWQPGTIFDEASQTHDALVPFAQLSPDDRQISLNAVCGEGAEDWLADLIDYPRGSDRPLTASEMRVGLGVVEIRKDAPHAAPTDGAFGEVVAWSCYPGGALKYVRVRWADGLVAEYHPLSGEIRRA